MLKNKGGANYSTYKLEYYTAINKSEVDLHLLI